MPEEPQDGVQSYGWQAPVDLSGTIEFGQSVQSEFTVDFNKLRDLLTWVNDRANTEYDFSVSLRVRRRNV